MAEGPRRAPGELASEVLALLWKADEPLTPGQVRDRLDADLAYTTVMTTLSRLHDKALITRERVGRAYVYSPAYDEAELAASRMRSLLDSGSDRTAVLTRFLGSLTKADERVVARVFDRDPASESRPSSRRG